MDLCGFGRDLWHWMGSGVGCGYGEGVEGVESGVRVLWMEGLEDWRRKSPTKPPTSERAWTRQCSGRVFDPEKGRVRGWEGRRVECTVSVECVECVERD